MIANATMQLTASRSATLSAGGRCQLTSRTVQSLPMRSCHRLVVRATGSKQQEDSAASRSASVLDKVNDAMLLAAAAATPLLLQAEPALAKGRELGILEGRIFSLMHPTVMGGLFVSSLYAAYLGFAWREVRTIPEVVKELKTQLPPANEEGVRPPSEVATKINELETKRKELLKGKVLDKHTIMGSVLLGGGVTFSVAGAFNTFIRTGKLFPGPHLYAGAAITVLWALAASLVPAMKGGNETARNAHITFNVINIALFAWQLPTGWDIVEKVLQFTTFP